MADRIFWASSVPSMRKKGEWQSLIRQMVATGLLRIDIAGYGGLGINDKGRALLRGDGEFLYREDAVSRTPATQKTPRATVPDQKLTDEQMVLLGILKDVRLEIAKERGVPAYIVFPDRSLIHMAQRTPRTVEDFAAINGVGAAKLKDFAEPFLAAIAGAMADQS